MAKEDWSEAKAWMRATRERIGMTQHDAAVLANLTVDMVKKYESEKYRIQPSGRMREMLEHYLAEHRRAVAAIMERHRGDERAVLSFSRVSNLPEGLPDWVRAEESVKRRAAAVREAAVLLEAEGVAVDYTYMPEELLGLEREPGIAERLRRIDALKDRARALDPLDGVEDMALADCDDDEQGDEAGGDDGDAPTFDSRL